MRVFASSLITVLICGSIGACSSRDRADMGHQWPNLSDIASAPSDAASPADHEAVIQALREEAEARKSEGYQAPEASKDADNN